MRIFMTITAVFLAAFFITAGSLSAKTYNLTYSIFFPASHDQYKAAEAWAEAVEEKTDGRVKITMFPGGTLTKAKNCYDGVVDGISDIGMSCFAYTRGKFPVMEACDLPVGYPDGKTASKAVNKYYEKMKPEELDDVKVLYIHAHGPGLLHTQKAVKTLEDFNKLKIRSTGFSAKVVDSLGGIPVAMSQGATYESLKKGVVEGTFGPVEVLKGWRQAEVIDYTTDTSNIGYTTTMYVVMNKNKFNKLPEDIKKIMTDLSSKWVVKHGNAWDESDKEGVKYSKSLGNEFITLSDEQKKIWEDKISPVIDEYVSSAEEKGINGRKNVEILRKIIEKSGSGN
ncbi:MAG: TRAP transporter substrate-binding protein [Thermodesulfobacteriota bacterium]